MKPKPDATARNEVHSSGLKLIVFPAQSIFSGCKDVVAGGGMERMGRSQCVALDHSDTELNPTYVYSFLFPKQNPSFGKFTTEDSLETERLWDMYNNFGTRNCGGAAAAKSGISRESRDTNAIESYKRAHCAWAHGSSTPRQLLSHEGKKGDTIVKDSSIKAVPNRLQELFVRQKSRYGGVHSTDNIFSFLWVSV